MKKNTLLESLKAILNILGINFERSLIDEEFLQIGLCALHQLFDHKIGYGDVAEIGKIMKEKFLSEYESAETHELREVFTDMESLGLQLVNITQFNEAESRLKTYYSSLKSMVTHYFVEPTPVPVSKFPDKVFEKILSDLKIENELKLLEAGTEKVRRLLIGSIKAYKKDEISLVELSTVANYVYGQLISAHHNNKQWKDLFDISLAIGELSYYARASNSMGQQQYKTFLEEMDHFYSQHE